MPQFIPIERTESYAPNIVGVVNWPEHLARKYSTKEQSPLPARGYIFDIHLNEIYGGLEIAIKHFIMQTENGFFNKPDAHFLLGYLKGRIGRDGGKEADVEYELDVSSNGREKTRPILYKCANFTKSQLGKGGHCSDTPNINGDMQIISGKEILHRRINGKGYASQNLPDLPGIKYLHEQRKELVKEGKLWRII